MVNIKLPYWEYRQYAYKRWGNGEPGPIRFKPNNNEPWLIDTMICNALQNGIQQTLIADESKLPGLTVEWPYGNEGCNYIVLPKVGDKVIQLLNDEFKDHFHSYVRILTEGDGIHRPKKMNEAIEYFCLEYDLNYTMYEDRFIKNYQRWRADGRPQCLDDMGMLDKEY